MVHIAIIMMIHLWSCLILALVKTSIIVCFPVAGHGIVFIVRQVPRN